MLYLIRILTIGHKTSVFHQKIIYKSNLVLLVEDGDGNLFGGYVSAKIDKLWECISDANALVFSLRSNGRFNGMFKFDIKDLQNAIYVYPESCTWLFSFGNGGSDGIQDDINVMKQYCEGNDQFSGCKQSSYNYNGIEHALCGKQTFIPKRIIVIQMLF